ncbi:hypothetical protein CHS0354_009417 [Potamilus streckersoni]|uniref:Uncharacterized protein n=1 Tax=Potamilus streckersoni TaxID=2493646 RepID=A0AAE0W715_9BIVA|nr:hypothetical protein CHS0354_009417 [Potamilus streckersoni]
MCEVTSSVHISCYRDHYCAKPFLSQAFGYQTLPSLARTYQCQQPTKQPGNIDEKHKLNEKGLLSVHPSCILNVPKSARSKKYKHTEPVLPKPKRVFQTKFGPMDEDMIDAIVHNSRYTSQTKRMAAEYALPIYQVPQPTDTRELAADMVCLKVQKYNPQPAEWQQVMDWDRYQPRASVNRPETPNTREKLLKRRAKVRDADGSKEIADETLQQDKLPKVFKAKCPGYAGYIPMCLPETKHEPREENEHLISTMMASFREFPSELFQRPAAGRQAPFSKLITVTYPFNPYNNSCKMKLKIS